MNHKLTHTSSYRSKFNVYTPTNINGVAITTQLDSNMFHISSVPPTEVAEFPINSYVLQNKLEDLKVTDLRPFRYDPIWTNPHEIATKDMNVYLVESTLTHKGSQAEHTHMTLKGK
jgi:hypothetical protein